MLRKRLSRWSSRAEGGEQPQSDFTDTFWMSYLDLLSHNAQLKQKDVLPVNLKKYSSTSSAVCQVRSFFTADLPQPSLAQIIALLRSPFSEGGNVARAFFLIRVFQLSAQGFFITNNNFDLYGDVIGLAGAENWENVLCYMDALLFSMFAKIDSFEPVLFLLNQNPNLMVGRLSALLRVYVILLRLGKLITTDISHAICECLTSLGFSEATSHEQQDCAPLFEFLTETLAMPLLTFRVEIQHSGKHDDDDNRYSKERILFVSVPEPKNDNDTIKEPITLEECLEHYFNNSISVRRELQRRATLDSLQYNPLGEGTVRLTVESAKKSSVDGSILKSTSLNSNAFRSNDLTISTNNTFVINSLDTTNTSITFNDEMNNVITDDIVPPIASRSSQVRVRTRSSTLSVWSINSFENKPKEVMLPAWMLLRLLPFYTDDNDTKSGTETFAGSSWEFANRRPLLPICLKRYSFSKENHQSSRSQRRILIPPVIEVALFVDNDSDDNMAGGFKLVLESAICHRGTSIQSGHYVSAVRVSTSLDEQTLADSQTGKWYLYDDMNKCRVIQKTFLEIFETEWPYMLFYRLVPSKAPRCAGSLALWDPRSHLSSPIIAPKGAKQAFWVEHDQNEPKLEALSEKDYIQNNSKGKNVMPNTYALLEIEEKATNLEQNKNDVLAPAIIVEEIPTVNNPKSTDPVSDLLPTNPNYIDIRKRYLWYVTDRKKNYYKESASLSKTGSNISICVTPQFRRNSQWSNLSNVSGLALESRHYLEESEEGEEAENNQNEKEGLKREECQKPHESQLYQRKNFLHRIFSHDREDIPKQLEKQQHKDASRVHSKGMAKAAKCVLM